VKHLQRRCIGSDPGGPSGFNGGEPNSWQESAPYGFPLNINLFASPSIGDFLPPSPTLGGSSVCLVPPAGEGLGTGWQGLSRPTLDRRVDLVTGLPLIQASDLELPFNGATFRLVRTRSQSPGLQARGDCPVNDHWWDWTGEGWMISENPLLLIDSTRPDTVGNNPPTCYLILDAFHSIPFQMIETSGLYEAPPRFSARLVAIGGERGTIQDGCAGNRTAWTRPPTSYEVSLYDGKLKYTFTPHYEDVPSHNWNKSQAFGGSFGDPANWCTNGSYHTRPFLPQQFLDGKCWEPNSANANPGLGVPYYGLCSKIEDLSGHSVEIEYCGPQQRGMDAPQTSGCVECQQNCPAKGQISRVHLKWRNPSSGTTETRWTLVYTYRTAPGDEEAPKFEDFEGDIPQSVIDEVYGRHVIDAIYAYENPGPSLVLPPTCAPISCADGYYSGGDPAHWLDAIDSEPANAPWLLPSGWKHRVRYHYSFAFATSGTGGPMAGGSGRLTQVPLLLKTTVQTREDPSSTTSDVLTESKVYRYEPVHPTAYGSEGNREQWLEAVFTQQDIDRLLDGV
jgi:hypothetical protein